MTRPLSISIIAWFYIIYSAAIVLPKIIVILSPEAYEVFSALMSAHRDHQLIHVPLWIQVLFSFLASFVLMAAGILLLKGNAWGRSLITLWTLSALLLVLLVSGLSFYLYLKVPLALLLIFLLFRPKANKYFKVNGSANPRSADSAN